MERVVLNALFLHLRDGLAAWIFAPSATHRSEADWYFQEKSMHLNALMHRLSTATMGSKFET